MSLLSRDQPGQVDLVSIRPVAALANFVGWWYLSGFFALVDAGYANSIGRYTRHADYYAVLASSLESGLIGAIAFAALIFFWTPGLARSVENVKAGRLDPTGDESRGVLLMGMVAVLIWIAMSLAVALRFAPDLWLRAIAWGAILGGMASVFTSWGYSLLRRRHGKIWIELVIILAIGGWWIVLVAIIRHRLLTQF